MRQISKSLLILTVLIPGLVSAANPGRAIMRAFSSSTQSSNSSKQQEQEEESTTIAETQCSKPLFEIKNQADLAAISTCQKVQGDIIVTEFDSSLFIMEGVSVIEGSFKVHNASTLQVVEAPDLHTVSGTLGLDTLTSLSSLSFPRLQSVDTIEWKVLPILSNANFDRGIKKIRSVVMQDTSLTGFVGFNVDTLNRLNINNNRFLERIESTVKEVEGELVIAANSKGLKVVLPNLVSARNIVIKDADSLSMASLESVETTAEFLNNKFSDLKLPKLKAVGTSLSISKNSNLKRADFTSLQDVGGGLIVIDNMSLNKIDFFPSLKSIGGAIEFHGNIDDSSLKQLRVVKGSAIVKSSSPNFDCNKWIKEEVSEVVRGGKIECGSGNSKTTEVFLVDDNGDVTKGAAGVNELKDYKSPGSEEDKSLNSNVESGGSYIDPVKSLFSAIMTSMFAVLCSML